MDSETIEKLLALSQLHLETTERESLSNDLDKILDFVDVMQTVNTDHVEPLSHPVDIEQPMRPDVADSNIQQEQYQEIAPVVRDGYYIVPKVISSQ